MGHDLRRIKPTILTKENMESLIGRKVRVINQFDGHGFKIGDIVTITHQDILHNNRTFFECSKDSSVWYLESSEFELLPIEKEDKMATSYKGIDDSNYLDFKNDKYRPVYYGGVENPYEVIKVIRAWNLGFELGNVLKYISRAGKKHDNIKEDIDKAISYLNMYKETL